MRFEFMGDPAIQGKVLWIRITNRPDRLDKADLRSGRSSERIPWTRSRRVKDFCAVFIRSKWCFGGTFRPSGTTGS